MPPKKNWNEETGVDQKKSDSFNEGWKKANDPREMFKGFGQIASDVGNKIKEKLAPSAKAEEKKKKGY